MSDDLTLVSISWRKKRRNHRLLFGTPYRHVRLDWRRHIAAFKPGDIFAYERWNANEYGTIHWSIWLLRAAGRGEPVCKVRGVRPGAEVLVSCLGKPACKSLLESLDKLREVTPLEEISSATWQQIGNRIATGMPLESVIERVAER